MEILIMWLVLKTCRVNLATGEIRRRNGEHDQLTTYELGVLRSLHASAGTVVTRTALMQTVWGWTEGRVERSRAKGERLPVDYAVHRLRARIEAHPGAPDHVRSVRGQGVRLDVLTQDGPPGAGVAPSMPAEDWVPRPDEQAAAVALLRAGRPLVVVGPHGSGTTRFARTIVREARSHQDEVVSLALDSPFSLRTREPGRYFYGLAVDIGESLEIDPEAIEEVWARAGTDSSRLRRFLRNVVLPRLPGALFLVFDPADALTTFGTIPNELYALLRALIDEAAEDDVLARLRVVLVLSSDPVLLTERYHASPFNLSPPVRLPRFDQAQVELFLAQRSLAPTEAAEAVRVAGAYPLLLGHYAAARRGGWVGGCAETSDALPGPLLAVCEDRLRLVREDPVLVETLRALLAPNPRAVDPGAADRLVEAGLLVRRGRARVIENDIYARFFAERL